MEPKEEKIIQGLKNGEESAYKLLYRDHYAVLCHYAAFYLHDDFLAESIVGDVIFHFWENRTSICINSSLRRYFMNSVRNKCLDHIKSKQAQTEQPITKATSNATLLLSTLHSDSSPMGSMLANELENKIMEVVNRLPKECKQVFFLSRFEHKKNQEIADLLHISINTVKYHIKNALKILRQELTEYLSLLATLFLLIK